MKTPTTAFPLNAWYAAAYDVEVRHALLPRTICNQKMVLFRRTDGQVAALEDACWHRLMPLSLGRLEGDEVVCGYHGLVYNSQGRCTHAIIQDTVQFAKLGLVIVDEQHRFGVGQRLTLRNKGNGDNVPHQLMMSATPIPRTLAMTYYADLEVSVIDELPPGRTPIVTAVVDQNRRDEVISDTSRSA